MTQAGFSWVSVPSLLDTSLGNVNSKPIDQFPNLFDSSLMLDVRTLRGGHLSISRSPLGTHCSTLSPQRASGRCGRVLEAQFNLNTDLRQKPMGELGLSFAMVPNYYLKLDLLLPLMGRWQGRKAMDSQI